MSLDFYRNHATKFLSDKIKERFQPSEQDPIVIWYKHFLLSENLDQYCRRVTDIVAICGKKWHVPAADVRLRKLRDMLDPNGKI